MDLLARFFLFDTVPATQLLRGTHDPALVGLSVGVAVFTSYLALALSERAREASNRRLKLAALAAGALSLGGGVWTMHFIGMLAFQICGRVDYDPAWTLGSMLPSLGAAWVALRVLTRQRVSGRQLLLAGVGMGGGIGLMHYGGMAAVRSSAQLRHDPVWFAASLVVAVGLSTLALWLHRGLNPRTATARRHPRLLAACSLGGAISGMHYTAMEAVRFIGTADAAADAQLAQHLQLALAVAFTALLVSGLATGLNAVLVQRQLQRDRLRSEQRLQAMVDTAVDGVVRLDGAGRILAVNRAAEQVFSAPEAALRGQALAALVPALAAQPADYAGVIESDARRRDGQAQRLRLAIGHSAQDGERQSVAFVTDITEARRRQAELEGMQTAIRRALVVVSFDVDGLIIDANDAFLQLTGHDRDSLIGQHHRVLCLPGEAASAAYAGHWAALRRGEFRTGDFERVRRDGRPIWIRATYNPILDAGGRPLRIVKFVNDLTERHQMEQDLRQAKVRAEQAASAKSSFLANMSHEIRTPMNAIIGFSEVALEGALPADARQHLHIIHRSARSLLGLLNDILDTAKLDHGAVELEQRDFSLRQLCADVAATLQIGAERKGLALRLALDPALPPCHRGDPMRLQQVLLNLVGNAVKFTEAGSVTVQAHPLPDGRLELAVQDTGIGIAADRLERIFEPFAQADASMTRRFGGTGLGTTIARQLVQLMGGEIGVHSTPGEGSRFWFRLALPIGQAAAATQTGARAAALSALPPLRILAADDVPENLQLLRLRLGALGHTVATAADGQQALARLQQGGLDLALLDVQMPALDGLQACRLLRAHEAATGAARLPVIALTASASDDDRQLTGSAGMDGFVVKPIDWTVLLAEMARVLGLGLQAPPPAHAEASPSTLATGALPETVDAPQALARWGDAATWGQQLHRFLASSLADWDGSVQDAALAHRLRGACANFSLTGLAAACTPLEQAGSAAAPADWQALHARLAALAAALQGSLAVPPAATATAAPAASAWPADAAQSLGDALARGELPEGPYQQVLAALPPARREALRDAVDGFDFDAAHAMLAQLDLEMA